MASSLLSVAELLNYQELDAWRHLEIMAAAYNSHVYPWLKQDCWQSKSSDREEGDVVDVAGSGGFLEETGREVLGQTSRHAALPRPQTWIEASPQPREPRAPQASSLVGSR